MIAWYFQAHARDKFLLNHLIDAALLSPREFEGLEWSARGKFIGEHRDHREPLHSIGKTFAQSSVCVQTVSGRPAGRGKFPKINDVHP